jgi:PII-like signaling protein
MEAAMNGFFVTFFTPLDRRHGHTQMHEWLLQSAKKLGVRGCTVVGASEGYGHHGRRHSVHFFELADQPIEVQMAMSDAQAAALFALLKAEKVDVFYVKAPVEFGRACDEGDARQSEP